MTDELTEPPALPSAATMADLKQIIREVLTHYDPQPPPDNRQCDTSSLMAQ